jgi:hypothetical protein
MSESAPDTILPSGLERLIGRCLEKEASKRFESMTDLDQALSRYVEDAAPVVIQSVPGGLSSPIGTSSGLTLAGGDLTERSVAGGQWALLGALGVLILGILGITIYVVWLGFQDRDSVLSKDNAPTEEREEDDKKNQDARDNSQNDEGVNRSEADATEQSPKSGPAVKPTDSVNEPDSEATVPPRKRPRRAEDRSNTVNSRDSQEEQVEREEQVEQVEQTEQETAPDSDFSIKDMEVIDPWENVEK